MTHAAQKFRNKLKIKTTYRKSPAKENNWIFPNIFVFLRLFSYENYLLTFPTYIWDEPPWVYKILLIQVFIWDFFPSVCFFLLRNIWSVRNKGFYWTVHTYATSHESHAVWEFSYFYFICIKLLDGNMKLVH